MSAVVVMSPEELVALVEAAVRKALGNGVSVNRASDAWVSIKSTGLPPTTVRRLIKDKRIRSLKVGRELRVSSEDLRAHLAELEEKQRAKKDAPEPANDAPVDAFEAARARARMRRSA